MEEEVWVMSARIIQPIYSTNHQQPHSAVKYVRARQRSEENSEF